MMYHKRRITFMILLVLIGVITSSLWIVRAAPPQQEGDHDDDHAPGECHHDDVTQIIMTHIESLTNFDEELEADHDRAIATLYDIGETLQMVALECGYPPPETDEHADEEMQMGDGEHDAADEHDDGEHEGVHSEAIAQAMTIGDAERGRELFNTVRPETGNLACATCHYVDRDDQLLGPGLLSTGRLDHDPSAHGMDQAMMDEHMDDEAAMDDVATDEAPTDGGHDAHMDDAATDEAPTDSGGDAHMEGMMDGDMVMDGDPGVAVVDYIRTSILEPGAFVTPGFPENLMPQIYAEIFTEQDINDIVAYILSLSR